MGRYGSNPDRGRNYLFIITSRPALDPASQNVGATGSLIRLRTVGRVSDHSLPSKAEVQNVFRLTTTPPISGYGMVLRHSGSLTLSLPSTTVSC
jgi:hypothetical protein